MKVKKVGHEGAIVLMFSPALILDCLPMCFDALRSCRHLLPNQTCFISNIKGGLHSSIQGTCF